MFVSGAGNLYCTVDFALDHSRQNKQLYIEIILRASIRGCSNLHKNNEVRDTEAKHVHQHMQLYLHRVPSIQRRSDIHIFLYSVCSFLSPSLPLLSLHFTSGFIRPVYHPLFIWFPSPLSPSLPLLIPHSAPHLAPCGS